MQLVLNFGLKGAAVRRITHEPSGLIDPIAAQAALRR
jgi:hypothetical protein